VAVGDGSLAAAAAEAAQAEADVVGKASDAETVKQALAGHCRGLADGDPGPIQAAAVYLAAAGRAPMHAGALADTAVLLAARGDAMAARRSLAAATAIYAGLGARWDMRRAAGQLQPYGIRLPRGASRPRPAGGWAALTPTELRVAGQLARGLSNPEIAAELFVSRNTVQTHVSHILAKLGARSRIDIARVALQQQADA
jgi:DNA-binding NarL/FixJ family response regulator